MKVAAARWLPYRLPFRQPWSSAGGRLETREGWLLRIDTDGGCSGWGDCAPFPGIGISQEAAVRYAEECALLDLAAQDADQPLAAWLGGDGVPASIAVNAALGDIGKLSPAAVEAACTAGFSVLKIKVGLNAPAIEVARLRELADTLPAGVRLRLDANQAWDEAVAANFLDACTALPVEGMEEPLRHPDADTLRRLQAGVFFPLAVDESYGLLAADFFAAPPVRRVILKPPRHGGLLPAMRLALQAREAGVECIVTSSLESACGLAACAHLAALAAPDAVHGLATAGWFAADTGEPPPIIRGRMILPDSVGIGFRPRIS